METRIIENHIELHKNQWSGYAIIEQHGKKYKCTCYMADGYDLTARIFGKTLGGSGGYYGGEFEKERIYDKEGIKKEVN